MQQCVPAYDLGGAVLAGHRTQQHRVTKVQVGDERSVGRAARLDLELVDLDVTLEEGRHRGGATADVAEHGVGRCGTRAECCIDPELAHERQQRQPVQHRHRECLAFGSGVRARQHVRCVVAGRGDHQVHPGDRLLEQQFGVGDVALHDRDAWQPLAEGLGAHGIVLDQDHRGSFALETLGDSGSDRAPAEHHHPSSLTGRGTEELQDLVGERRGWSAPGHGHQPPGPDRRVG